MNDCPDDNDLKDEDMKKVVFKDDQDFKAIKGWIISEDDYFITLHAHKSNAIIRIGKAHIVLIRPAAIDKEPEDDTHQHGMRGGEEP